MIMIGLTGSIGMGKSTAAAMLETLGVPVHDSDAAVKDLWAHKEGEAYQAICAAFPHFEYPDIYKNKQIDRQKFSGMIFKNDKARTILEGILHPLVRASQNRFIRIQKKVGRKIIALDIPLLFETGADQRVDYVAVVSAPPYIQRTRVLQRENMTEDKFESIIARQMPDTEKCARADFVIQTGLGRAETMQQIKTMLLKMKKSH